ncbi:hypothetical protein TNCV_4325301 [Trichonephila clavipes]|nr:hypothetical protein TNCV_4325301 [Trichonephila clavipes]
MDVPNIRVILLHESKLGNNYAKAACNMKEAFRENTVNLRKVQLGILYREIRYQSEKRAGCVESTKTIRNCIGMEGCKRRSCELWCKEEGEKKEQKRINGTKNILLKDCKTTSARNYDQKSSGSPNSGAERNSLRSGRLLACHISFRQLQIFER